MKTSFILLALVMMFVTAAAENTVKTDVWEPFRFFVGKWEGSGEGKPGISKGKQEFQFVLNEKYLKVTNKSIFESQEKNPKGEVHEDFGFFSFDTMRQKYVFRQFHGEGFVNQYVLDNISDDKKTLTFVSEQIENAPPGLKAKLIYTKLNDNEFQLSFELAFPGKEFACYSTGKLNRLM
jgi:hypothetical protein